MELPLVFAYRSTVQESTRESPFFSLYGHDPQLPTRSVVDEVEPAYLVDMEDYRTEFLIGLAKAKKLALENIGRLRPNRSSMIVKQEIHSTGWKRK